MVHADRPGRRAWWALPSRAEQEPALRGGTRIPTYAFAGLADPPNRHAEWLEEAVEHRLGPALEIDASRWMPPADEPWRTVPIAVRPRARVYSHAALRARAAAGIDVAGLPADVASALQRAIADALGTGSALVVRVERIWPHLAPTEWSTAVHSSDDHVAPDVGVHDAVHADELFAAAQSALRFRGTGHFTLTLDEASRHAVVGAPVVTVVHEGQTWSARLPRSTSDLDGAQGCPRVDVEQYWREVQPHWEQAVVRALFPVEGPGFTVWLEGTSWSPAGVTASIFVTSTLQRRARTISVLFPRVLLDGWIDPGSGAVDPLPLVESHEQIREWRRAIAATHVDATHDLRSLFTFLEGVPDRPPITPRVRPPAARPALTPWFAPLESELTEPVLLPDGTRCRLGFAFSTIAVERYVFTTRHEARDGTVLAHWEQERFVPPMSARTPERLAAWARCARERIAELPYGRFYPHLFAVLHAEAITPAAMAEAMRDGEVLARELAAAELDAFARDEGLPAIPDAALARRVWRLLFLDDVDPGLASAMASEPALAPWRRTLRAALDEIARRRS